MHVEEGTCNVKSELLRQGTWLENDDMRRPPPFFVDWIASEVEQKSGQGGGSKLEVGAALRFELGNDDLLRPFASGCLPVFVWIVWGLP